MDAIAGSPFLWLHFDEAGALHDPSAAKRLADAIAGDKVRHLVVISHGWNNDERNAADLYTGLWTNALQTLAQGGAKPEEFVVVGVLWPAKEYDADYDGAEATEVRPQSGGGTKSVGDDPSIGDIGENSFQEKLALLDGFVGPDAAEAIKAAARALDAGGGDQAAFDFFKTAREHLGVDEETEDSELLEDRENFKGTKTLFGADDAINALAMPPVFDVPAGTGGAKGLGNVVLATFQGTRSGVLWALNKLTYYTMKKRAGLVGRCLAQVLGALRPPRTLKLHLVGHSFGARLVTSAAANLAVPPNLEFQSLTLLQGAYSHNALTGGNAVFASALGKPRGAIVYTHTHNDKACTIAYPLASRLSGDTSKSIGGADDPFGAMGANGPQGLPAGATVRADPAALAFEKGKVNLVLADTFVVAANGVDAHNNVATPACGKVVAMAMTA
ncbi:MAG TPA: hypothetical protein VFH89_02300 [Sphingomicrobium sp.]|nr:hypothetical protein [Sphingomicrobium sp.]